MRLFINSVRCLPTFVRSMDLDCKWRPGVTVSTSSASKRYPPKLANRHQAPSRSTYIVHTALSVSLPGINACAESVPTQPNRFVAHPPYGPSERSLVCDCIAFAPVNAVVRHPNRSPLCSSIVADLHPAGRRKHRTAVSVNVGAVQASKARLVIRASRSLALQYSPLVDSERGLLPHSLGHSLVLLRIYHVVRSLSITRIQHSFKSRHLHNTASEDSRTVQHDEHPVLTQPVNTWYPKLL